MAFASVLLAHAALFAALGLSVHAPPADPLPPVVASLYEGESFALAPTTPQAQKPTAPTATPPPAARSELQPRVVIQARPPIEHAIFAKVEAPAPAPLLLTPVFASPDQFAVPLTNDAPAPGTLQAPGAGQACRILDSLQAELQGDVQVKAALALVPAAARSVANAIMLWDGRWAEAASVGGVAAIDPIRNAIASDVRAAPAACRDEPVRGPRLISISEGKGTTVLALGSGVWRWSDLLGEGPPAE